MSRETLTVEALRFFAAEPDQAWAFFGWSGLDAGTIRAAATKPGFSRGVLEYLMQDEAALLGFAAHSRLEPAAIAALYEAEGRRSCSDDDGP